MSKNAKLASKKLSRMKIEEVKQPQVKTIESVLTIKEVADNKKKIIENSEAWKKHQKEHDDAQLRIVGKELLSTEEKSIERLTEKEQKKEERKEDDKAGKLPDEEKAEREKPAQEQAKPAEDASRVYHAGHSPGELVGVCSCGQVFKTEGSQISTYNIGSENVEQAFSYKIRDDISKEEKRGYKTRFEENEKEERKYSK